MDRLEERTRRIGRELFARIDTSGPSVFNQAWWDDWVMDWAMADEAVKVQMFRFIDVLPMLPDSRGVAEHLRAYFSTGNGHYPLLVRWGVGLAEPGSVAGELVARAIRLNGARLARRFIAGQTPAEVTETVRDLWERGFAFTLDLLGEATVTEAEADDYQTQYLDLLDYLGPRARDWPASPRLEQGPDGPVPRVNVSIKVTALASQFDPIDPSGSFDIVARRLRPVFQAARAQGAFVNIDMEQYSAKDLTLTIFRRLLTEPAFRDWSDAGIAMQAYLPDTERDLVELLDWAKSRGAPVWVRLVKGAYWDYETVLARQRHWPVPVFTQKWQSDACFERCSRFLLENRQWLRPAIASHNLRSIAHALATAEELKAPPGSFELQMLYGMGDELKDAIAGQGARLRIYTPFGKLLPGMAYLVRRLLENTSNTSFLRATFTEKTSVEELLRSPEEIGANRPEEIPMPAIHDSPTLAPFVNEPVTDFSRSIERERMRVAIKDVRGGLGRTYFLSIAGREIADRPLLASVNPAAYREVIGQFASASADDAASAADAAAKAFPRWRRTSVWRRAQVLFDTAEAMRRRRFELAAWMILECGKPWREADADVAEAIDFCEFYAREMIRLSRARTRNVPGEDNAYSYIPRGPAVAIAPWNFPLAILCGMTVAPLVAGNPVILKPAEQSSIIAAKFFEILREQDLPPGVCQFLPGVGEVAGAALVSDPRVAIVSFTGSVAVGLAIQAQAAKRAPGQRQLKKVIAEMGGKNAIIIDDDADLDEAVKGVVGSAFGYQGQKCSACSRVIVHRGVYDAFVSRLQAATASLTIGPPEDPANAVGPVIDAEARDRLLGAIEKGKSEAQCLHAGDVGELSKSGYFVAPHLFADSPRDSLLARTELFGPVLAIFRARDISDALSLANDTDYALTGGVYSRNPVTIDRCKEEFEVGNLYINRRITGAEVDRQPFGGYRLSGIGAKAGGPDYLGQFLVPRTVTENTLRRGFAPEEGAANEED